MVLIQIHLLNPFKKSFAVFPENQMMSRCVLLLVIAISINARMWPCKLQFHLLKLFCWGSTHACMVHMFIGSFPSFFSFLCMITHFWCGCYLTTICFLVSIWGILRIDQLVLYVYMLNVEWGAPSESEDLYVFMCHIKLFHSHRQKYTEHLIKYAHVCLVCFLTQYAHVCLVCF